MALSGYLSEHNLFPPFQSAYRKLHSAETALLKVFSDITTDIDSGQLALLSILDLSAVFDTVDHDILIQRLTTSFRIQEIPLCWLQSYLTDLTQSVQFTGQSTSPCHIECGVPQGSVLGPLLFLIYTADVGHIIKTHGLLHHCYADDSQLYFFCRQGDDDILKPAVLACIEDVVRWTTSNHLQLNLSKMSFFGAPQHAGCTSKTVECFRRAMVTSQLQCRSTTTACTSIAI